MPPTTPRPTQGSPRTPGAELLLLEAYGRDRQRMDDALEGVRRALCSLARQVELCMDAVYASDRRVIRLEEQVQRLAERVDRSLAYLPADVERRFDEWFGPGSSDTDS